jgi:methyl coenzyme M reductase subunit D
MLLLFEQVFNRHFVEFFCFPLDDFQGTLRTVAEACPQPVAIYFGNHTGLPIHYLKRSFCAVRDALSASVTEIFIDLNYFS